MHELTQVWHYKVVCCQHTSVPIVSILANPILPKQKLLVMPTQ